MAVEKNDIEKSLVQLRRIEAHREADAEKEIRRIYKELLKDLKQFVGFEYAELAENGELTHEILRRKGEHARFLEEIEWRMAGASPEITGEVKRLVSDTYELGYRGVREAVLFADTKQELKDLVRGSGVSPETIKRVVDEGLIDDVLKKNWRDDIYAIKRDITTGLTNGDRVSTMAKRIAKSVDTSYKKAITIARTESHRAREAGMHDGASAIDDKLKDGVSGQRMVKIWRTMKDERVRPNRGRGKKPAKSGANHVIMEGVTILMDEKFELSDGTLTTAPSQSGVASQDINCRCYLSYDLMNDAEYFAATGKHFEGFKSKSQEITYDSKLADIDKEEFTENVYKKVDDYTGDISFGGHYRYDQIYDEVKNAGGTVDDLIEALTASQNEYRKPKIQEGFKKAVSNAKTSTKSAVATTKATKKVKEAVKETVGTPYALGHQASDKLSVETYAKWKKDIEKTTGKTISDKRVKEMLDATFEYTAEGYLDICSASGGFKGIFSNYANAMMDESARTIAKKKADAIEELLEKAPKYDGKKAYRGLGFSAGGDLDDGSWERFVSQIKEGEVIKMESMSSWSAKEGVANQFASMKSSFDETADTFAKVVIEIDNPRSGVKIADLAEESVQYQDEVLFSKDVQYKVTKVTKNSYTGFDGSEHIEMRVYVTEV